MPMIAGLVVVFCTILLAVVSRWKKITQVADHVYTHTCRLYIHTIRCTHSCTKPYMPTFKNTNAGACTYRHTRKKLNIGLQTHRHAQIHIHIKTYKQTDVRLRTKTSC